MRKSFTYLITLFISSIVSAQPFLQWDFEASSFSPSLTPTPTTGSLSLVGGITSNFASGDKGSAAALNTSDYPAAATASGSAGIEVAVTTFHKGGIVIGWASRNSNSSSKYMQVLLSADAGATWSVADLTAENTIFSEATVDYINDVFSNPTPEDWYDLILDLSLEPAANNNPKFRFRVVSVFAPGTSDYTPANDGSTYSVNGTIRFDNVTVGSNGTLPLKLTSFNVISDENSISLRWTTTNEINVKQFNIEKSYDAVHFSTIGNVAAKNNITQNTYSYKDAKLLLPVAYYRLNMISKDNSQQFSAVVSVKNVAAFKVVVYPNPVASQLVLMHPKALQNATLQLVTADGKKTGAYNIQQGAVQTTINVSKLNKGVYYILYQNGNNLQTGKFSKK